jgi:hypothetical protein
MLTKALAIVATLLLAGTLIIRAIKAKRVFKFDEGTTLLFKQRDIKRSSLPKSNKAIQLNELDLSIDVYLKQVQVGVAKKLS